MSAGECVDRTLYAVAVTSVACVLAWWIGYLDLDREDGHA